MHFTAVNVEAAALSGISGASYDQTKDLLEKIDVVPTEKLKGDEQKLGAVVADVEMLAVCLSVCLFVCLSVCLFVCLSVYFVRLRSPTYFAMEFQRIEVVVE